MKKLFDYIRNLADRNFYGNLLIKFEHGKIKLCELTEKIKF